MLGSYDIKDFNFRMSDGSRLSEYGELEHTSCKKALQEDNFNLEKWLIWEDDAMRNADPLKKLDLLKQKIARRGDFPVYICGMSNGSGILNLSNIDKVNGRLEMEPWLSKELCDHKDKGYWQFFIDYLFHELRMRRIEIRVLETNSWFIDLLEKSGFKAEGILRSYVKRPHACHDAILFALLKRDWQRRAQRF